MVETTDVNVDEAASNASFDASFHKAVHVSLLYASWAVFDRAAFLLSISRPAAMTQAALLLVKANRDMHTAIDEWSKSASLPQWEQHPMRKPFEEMDAATRDIGSGGMSQLSADFERLEAARCGLRTAVVGGRAGQDTTGPVPQAATNG